VLGDEGALALMRAMNEPLETVVRLARGEPSPSAQETDVPGAYRVERVSEALVASGRIWPQSRGSQLAGLCVGSQAGERVLDLCAAPGGKTGQLRGQVTAVEIDPARARELRENLATMGRNDATVVEADGTALPPELEGFDRALVDAPCSGLGVLAQRPPLAREAAPRAPARAAQLGRGACPSRRHDRLLRLHDQQGRMRGDRRRERPARPAARGRVAGVRASDASRVPAHAPARPWHQRFLHRSSRTIARMTWPEWVRTAEVEPSLYAADFARLGDQVDVLLGAGCRIFHFDVGDGHFVEPVTIGPVVLESIAPRVHEAGGVLDCHLMVDNPLRHFPQIARAGGDSATFHYEVVDDVPATIAAAREHGLEVGVAFNPESEPEDVAAVAGDADLVLCMSIHPGYSGQKFRPDAVDRIRRLRAALPEHIHIQVDGGIDHETIGRAHDAGATLLVAGSAVFGRGDLADAYCGLVRDLE
jgi:ribulose-phosphate 3-epimerase